MSFQPALPLSGLAGWRFLERTLDTQQAAFAEAPALARDADHFRARIGEIDTAEALVADRRLLTVALGAFGLQQDIDSRFFVRKILEDGTARPDALANRLADKRYADFARAFAFDAPQGPATQRPGFGQEVAARFERQSFEAAVGEQDESLRLALNADRELAALAAAPGTERTKWFRIMGTPPLRRVVETALGLPESFGAQDIDKQIETFQARSDRMIGTRDVSALADAETRDALIQRFLFQDQIARAPAAAAPGSVALTLLQNAARGPSLF